jgi:hypothetical protein
VFGELRREEERLGKEGLVVRDDVGQMVLVSKFGNCIDQELYLNALIVRKEWGDLGKVLTE